MRPENEYRWNDIHLGLCSVGGAAQNICKALGIKN